jgi:hypothetical protein
VTAASASWTVDEPDDFLTVSRIHSSPSIEPNCPVSDLVVAAGSSCFVHDDTLGCSYLFLRDGRCG